jgi:hypothetical protein
LVRKSTETKSKMAAIVAILDESGADHWKIGSIDPGVCPIIDGNQMFTDTNAETHRSWYNAPDILWSGGGGIINSIYTALFHGIEPWSKCFFVLYFSSFHINQSGVSRSSYKAFTWSRPVGKPSSDSTKNRTHNLSNMRPTLHHWTTASNLCPENHSFKNG